MTYNDEKRTLDLPDTELRFFAYGIFKPGQLAYSKIKNHVYEIENAEINYPMKHRDGVPIIINDQRDHYQTKGYIITFREGQEEDTYKIISKTLLRKLYEWKTIEINTEKVNVLFGVNPKKGSDYIEDMQERINFNGKNDPLFSEALKLIERNLNSERNLNEIERIFELQMNYMLLWSAIDRFSSLKYNQQTEKKNRKKFANQKAFKEGIKKFEEEYHRPVYSTDDLRIHKFNVEDPVDTLYYYYTLRCNVVHRGKGSISDYSMLKQATVELLEIFKGILENTFDDLSTQ